MRVLDLYPTHSWSFTSDNPVIIRQMRAAVALNDETVRNSELSQIKGGRAYRLVGDPAALELSEDFFDEIQVEYTPPPVKCLILRQKCKRWLQPFGRLYFPEPAQTSETEPIRLRASETAFAPA